MKNKIEAFLQDITFNTKFEFLDTGSDLEELKKVAAKRGIKLPSPDLSVFKGRYAFTDRQNKNGCTLPRNEVEKALETINGKAIDFDHLRKRVVGHWIDAKLEDDEIIAYGAFFKSNFPEDYKTIKSLMENDVLAISFEAWGKRTYSENGSYTLSDIEFAGGGLLIKTKPAFPGSEVLEMANEKVLEMASTLIEPKEYVHIHQETTEEMASKQENRGKCVFQSTDPKVKDNKDHFPCNDINQARNALARVAQYSSVPKWYSGTLEEVVAKVKAKVKEWYPSIEVTNNANYSVFDISAIFQAISSIDCPVCSEKGCYSISMLDFANNIADVTCLFCDSSMNVNLTPSAVLVKKGEPKIDSIELKNEDHASLNKEDKKDIVGGKEELGGEFTMKKLLEQYKVESVDKLFQEVAKVSIQRELTESELNLAYSLTEFVAGGGSANSTSLLSLKAKSSIANPTSLLSASITEDNLKLVVAEVKKDSDFVELVKASVDQALSVQKKASDELISAKEAELASLKAKLAEFEQAKADAEAKAKVDLIAARKAELANFAAEMTDEQLLNDDKFTIAKQNKMIAELQGQKQVVKASLEKGSSNKDAEDSILAARKRIREMAFSDGDNDED